MNATATRTWAEANQECLMAWLAVVRDSLQGRASTAELRRAADEASREIPGSSALDMLCASFRLSPFEREALLLCAAVELDAAFAPLCAEAQRDPRKTYPTFSLALAALHGPHWSAITPVGPLRRWKLIELLDPNALTASPLRIDESILHYLTGIAYTDERLSGWMERVERAAFDLSPSHRNTAAALARAWSNAHLDPPLPVAQLCGSDPAARRAVAAAACEALGLKLYVAQASLLPAGVSELETAMRLWEREAVLMSGALLVECDPAGGLDPAQPALNRIIEHMPGAVIVSSRERRGVLHRSAISLEVPRLTASERREAWTRCLGRDGAAMNGSIEALSAQFSMSVPAIRSASVRARAANPDAQGPEMAAHLWDACRDLARPRLDDLAQRIEANAGWDDLVLPGRPHRTLQEIAMHARHQAKVYETWGFASKGTRGLGISALFSGSSGTGKTMAAEVLAKELNLDLYKIDLSAVVSKYIGETEKNLRRIFDAAEAGGAILLFDEADALFGKRTEVKDSHDRYANIEVSYLLQRMEAYRGLAILTTNMKSALDHAFLRRLRFTVDFPFPGNVERAAIWRRIFPAETPVDGLDFTKLAQLNVAGGHIRNIALSAAFLAADSGEPVRMHHLLKAARAEAAKLENTLSEAEVCGWA
jgi:ATPase family associated with various cellular activities (AAA)